MKLVPLTREQQEQLKKLKQKGAPKWKLIQFQKRAYDDNDRKAGK